MSHVDVPYKVTEHGVEHQAEQIRTKVFQKLEENYGVDTSDEAIRKAVEEHNEICRIITEMGEYRKEDNPRITGYEFHILNLVTYVCPKYLILEKLRETLEEIKNREPDEKRTTGPGLSWREVRLTILILRSWWRRRVPLWWQTVSALVLSREDRRYSLEMRKTH